MLAGLSFGWVSPAFASDEPIVINGHLKGEIINAPLDASASVGDAANATGQHSQDTDKPPVVVVIPTHVNSEQEVYWGYVTPTATVQKTIRRRVRTEPPWTYKPTNKRYTPRPHRAYQPKQSWTYHPKQFS